jgi:gamma-glutamyl:cysteine ligase YbdK (ATP-grasp superfamily)
LTKLSLFDAFGVEVEYMIVSRATLDVLPVADQLLEAVAGNLVSEVESGGLCWSNELVLHVIELKTSGPARRLESLPALFSRDVLRINQLLEPIGGMLLSTAMHPLMNPASETRLWPHEDRAIYECFDHIFDCKAHGFANLQSVHLNLPFCGDAEFGKLHAAVRLVLPLIPALAASSPLVEGCLTGLVDNRLEFYRTNCSRVPSVTGAVIPEPVFTEREYSAEILDTIARDIAAFDKEQVLEPIWVNARGAIARFDRGSIEIRLIDTQECPTVDLAVAAFVAALVRGLVEARWSSTSEQQAWPVDRLERLLRRTIADGSRATVDDAEYTKMLGCSRDSRPARQLIGELVDRLTRLGLLAEEPWRDGLGVIVRHGCLSERIRDALGRHIEPAQIRAVYRQLAHCLARDVPFVPGAGAALLSS